MASEENQVEDDSWSIDEETEALNRLLRAEQVAAAVYRRVTSVIDDGELLPMLVENSQSHQERAELLRDFVAERNGAPAASDGMGEGYAGQVVAAASLGPKAVLTALEQIENKCLRLYRRELESLGASNRVVVERVLLPAQWLSGDTISALLNFLH